MEEGEPDGDPNTQSDNEIEKGAKGLLFNDLYDTFSFHGAVFPALVGISS